MRGDIKDSSGEAVKRQDPEVQLIKLREFASNHGWEVVEEYVDRASGSDASRPSFDDMMAAAYRHEFDLILVVRIDRIMRSLVNLLNVLQTLQKWLKGTKSGKPIGREPSFTKEQLTLAESIRGANPEISWSELSRAAQIDRRTLRRYFGEGG
jgi:DNA invertase Pin-like site-specific DNA recombinase